MTSFPSGLRAARRLAERGVLLSEPGSPGYGIDDPFFARWIRNGRVWTTAEALG